MHISVHATKNAMRYEVRLDGAIVERWIEADDVAGFVVREVPDDSGQVRFLRQERISGTVTISPPVAGVKDTA